MPPSIRRRSRFINIDSINIDESTATLHDGAMSTLIGADEAARTLGVTKPTLYAYVSRGLVGRQLAVDGRTSLYDRDAIELLANRSRRRPPVQRPSIDVQIATDITRLHDDSPTYRGHRLLDLVTERGFEEIAELMFTGTLPEGPVRWDAERAAVARAKAVIGAAATFDPITMLSLATCTLEGPDDPDDPSDPDPNDASRAATTGRRLLALAPSLLGGPMRGTVASRLAQAWVRRPSPELVTAIDRALVLLADHELATSTLAVRVAASVRASPAAAIVVGLGVVSGPLHGAASRAAAELFDDAATSAAAVHRRLDAGERLPGFGHSVYRKGDPRFMPLLDAVRAIPVDPDRLAVVDAVIGQAGREIGHLPNVDLALGALYFVGELPHDAPVFAIARIAGWTAHYVEELGERPVRFRGLSRER
jgi:citrate synthase